MFYILMVMNYTDTGEQRREGELDRELEPGHAWPSAWSSD